ncbi:exo-alpha-sialidase [Algoriphagus namhaensis]|uniref:Exo-alpha-sialidase n=1 Tax=Algoriphagus namhaensis TaxID=915353 RepID=A0ABV8AP20_9BACT
MKFILFLIAFSLGLVFQAEKPKEIKILRSEFIYESAPFPECHASTLVETSDGILAAWFGGTRERNPDVSIYTSRLSGEKWSTPEMVADGVVDENLRYPTWNPVLFQNKPEQLTLFYKIGPSPREWWGAFKTSSDEGKTWSEEIKLEEGFLGPIKNKSVFLPNGDILHPSSLETSKVWTIHVEKSDANLENWRKIEIENGSFNAIQPTVLFLPGGKIQLLSRTQEGKVGINYSEDQGETWSRVKGSSLPNNNSGVDGITLKSGYHLLVCNPLQKGRNKLSLMGSEDGNTWEELLVLEDQSSGEFSYPAIIQAKDGTVHLTYTYNRKRIKYVSLTL